MRRASWKQRAFGATLALLVQAGFLQLILVSPSHPPHRADFPHETILLFSRLAMPAPSLIDARGSRKKRTAPGLAPVPPPIVTPPFATALPVPPSGLAGFGRSLFGCAPEYYATLSPEERAHCPKPGEGLAKNDDRDLNEPPRSHAKYEAMWQEQWIEDHWTPAPCLPTGEKSVARCLMDQAIAENRRAKAAWERIAAERAAALAVKNPPPPASIRSRQR
jgi:hypothetical protein